MTVVNSNGRSVNNEVAPEDISLKLFSIFLFFYMRGLFYFLAYRLLTESLMSEDEKKKEKKKILFQQLFFLNSRFLMSED